MHSETTLGMIVPLIAVQLLFGRKRFRLPRWLMKRAVAPEKMEKALNRLQPAARFIDCGLRPRLSFFSYGVGLGIVAIACIAIAMVMPVMEIVPFSATSAGAILTILGLSLIAKDGFMALLGHILSILVFVVIAFQRF